MVRRAGGTSRLASSYYHRADSAGIGFDRSPSGSDAVGQYPEPFRSRYADVETCPEELLLWFHHVPCTHRMKSGLTLREEMGGLYQRGLETVEKMQGQWGAAQPWLDSYIYKDVERRLMTQAATRNGGRTHVCSISPRSTVDLAIRSPPSDPYLGGAECHKVADFQL